MDKQAAVRTAPQKVTAEQNQRYIYAKLPYATPRQLAMIAGFIRGMGICGCHCGERSPAPPEGNRKGGGAE